jgi:GNAT superfamily N-acetyltransferase
MTDQPMTGTLRLRRLTTGDLAELQALLEADPDYVRRVTGADPGPGEAADLLTGRPPGLPAERKVLLGAYDDHGLAAIVDVLRGWPDAATAPIGLLQVYADRKRQGVGRRTHDLLLELVEGWPEITVLRAAIVAINAAGAAPFWADLGYRPAEPPKPYQAGPVATTVTAWTRPGRPR